MLKFAAPVFVNLLQDNNGIGVVDFDHDAYDRMAVQTAGPPSAFDPTRATALGVIAAHAPNPAGITAIGDGVEHAHDLLAATAGFDNQAMIVFTDGFETASKYIADVAGRINERVFAIGLGTADQVKPTRSDRPYQRHRGLSAADRRASVPTTCSGSASTTSRSWPE